MKGSESNTIHFGEDQSDEENDPDTTSRVVQVEGLELKSTGSCIEYKRLSKSCLSDKSPMYRESGDRVFISTPKLIRGISHSNKSNNLTE